MLDSLTLELFPDEMSDELAQTCASSGVDSDGSDSNQFTYLEEAAQKKAKEVARTGRSHESAWEALFPILDKMQKLLSQRGAEHAQADQGLPEWKVWWKSFSTKNKLNVSFRTVQDRLKKYREASSGEKSRKPRVSLSEQQALTATAKVAHRLAAAVQSGEGVSEALDMFIRDSIPLDQVDEIEGQFPSSKDEFNRSGKRTLANVIIRKAGPQIQACLKGLGPSEMREVLQATFSEIVRRFCDGDKIHVSFENSAPPLAPERAELILLPMDRGVA
jgi:hypothetical protein